MREQCNFLVCLLSIIAAFGAFIATLVYLSVPYAVVTCIFLYTAIDAPLREFKLGHREEWYVPTILELCFKDISIITTKQQRINKINTLIVECQREARGLKEGDEYKIIFDTKVNELIACRDSILSYKERKHRDKVIAKANKVVQKELKA